MAIISLDFWVMSQEPWTPYDGTCLISFSFRFEQVDSGQRDALTAPKLSILAVLSCIIPRGRLDSIVKNS